MDASLTAVPQRKNLNLDDRSPRIRAPWVLRQATMASEVKRITDRNLRIRLAAQASQ